MGNRWPLPDSNLPSSPHTVSWSPPLHSNPIQPSIDNFTPWTEGSTTSDGATLSGPAAYSGYSAAYVPILPVHVSIPNYTAMESQELPTYSVPSNANSDPRQSMPPPALNPRKRKAPTLRAGDWTPVKARIIELHIDDNMPLPEVKIAIEEEFPFEATLRQYRSAVTSWGFDKNVKKNVMQAIVRKRQHRRLVEPGKKDLNFKVHNFTVNPGKVDTWMKRNNIPGDAIYAPSPAASTPTEMMAWTPSEQASSPSGGPSSSHTPIAMAIQSPQGGYGSTIHSPTPSVSSILESHDSDFTGQSPAPWPTNDEAPTHPYLSADEAQLRLQLSLHREQSGLDDNLDALHTELKLGQVRLEQGRYRSAEETFRKLISRCRVLYGKSHRHTLRALQGLGEVVWKQGLYNKAMKIFQECFKTQKTLFGFDHPDTLRSMAWVAFTLTTTGHFSDAEAMQRQTLELSTKVLGAEHPSTIDSTYMLAFTLRDQGRHSHAEAMFRQVSDFQTRVLGAEHPDTLQTMSRIAEALHNQGHYSLAEAIYRQVLELQAKVVGAEHPDTLQSTHMLAFTIHCQGHYSDAEAMYRQLSETQIRVIGAEHPNTLSSISCIAMALHFQGHNSEAVALFRQVSELQTKVEGEEHPNTLATMFWHAQSLAAQGYLSEAGTMHRHVLKLRTKILGADHPETVASKKVFSSIY
ncbi:hypothetical protein PFICI_02412 [Pestalotiopsis fici W106-1]|uniref:Clr5 domain-containing protein n=1 Tax=Pestalotiopsis fici (strain W106-1 / CGMCC3.15140) TaxID=1229662 RepID=W3XG42_PESFW|nr:uncharacterized protein PFICI_02412 [Pestalotiopsis fici W106-1]ETS84387.1 hypothetical protein PFICI_02412 [Pestalotiopsis fici W106-1]